MKSAENLLRALTRAMLGNPDLEPEIVITTGGGRMQVEIDVRPFDPAPLIGSQGTMKFAIQQLLAGRGHPSSWELHFRQTGRARSPELKNIAPQTEPMASVLNACVNHWRSQSAIASSKVELSETTVVAILILDDTLGQCQRAAFSRVARAIGKANGYRGTCIIEKPAVLA